jgi:hypothetical protein
MIINTTLSLRRQRHRLEGRMERAEQTLKAMQRGAALRLQFTPTGPRWSLSNGSRVKGEVAKLVIASASVTGVGDALFEGAASQTFRWWADVT